ncbi:HlyD family secretion protein [Chitinophaga sp. Hz27]|uniref:HlyD family secretion protein n=1 Tax=Chitinophaga sp. Hz27 TaxID=3347169 RepID=UPI0035E0B14E
MDQQKIADSAYEEALPVLKLLQNNGERSEMTQEIISRKPGFVEKWALLIFMGILLALFGATWFIRYPDIVETRATLTAANAPKEIIARQEGRLVKLFLHNNEKVKKGEVFGWIECTGSHKELLALSERVDSSVALLNTAQGTTVSALFNKQFNNLGEIQQGYQAFITSLQLYNDYIVNGFFARRKEKLQIDIQSLERTNLILHKQIQLAEQDVKLAEETYKMNLQLSEEKVLSSEEFRQEKSKFVNKQMAIPQMETSLIANETQIRNKAEEISQLDHDMQQQQVVFQQAMLSLKSSIDEWKKKYVLQSPVDGKIVFVVPIQENQFMQPGKIIGYINPEDSHFYAEAYLPQSNFGKVDTGLKVQLRFDAYPYQELGFVEGTINYISNVGADSGFLATIRLDNGLMTNNRNPIPYRSGLKAQGIVITRNMRLLQRIGHSINRLASVGNK